MWEMYVSEGETSGMRNGEKDTEGEHEYEWK
jgi:hypothetical protein